jgi:hypothetical protein
MPALQVRWSLSFEGWPSRQSVCCDGIEAIESRVWGLEIIVSSVYVRASILKSKITSDEETWDRRSDSDPLGTVGGAA